MLKYTTFLMTLSICILFGQSDTKYRDIFFLNSDHGWIQTNNSLIYITRDGGESWIERVCPDGRLYFLDEMTGWIISNEYIYKSTDGGEQWIMKNHFAGHHLFCIVEHHDFYYLFGQDSNYSEVIYKSSVDSLTWIKSEIDNIYFTWIRDIKFSGDIGYASNGLTIYKTDNLSTWYQLPVYIDQSDGPGVNNSGRLQIISQDTVIVQKLSMQVYYVYGFSFTVDQGENWSDYPHLKWPWQEPDFYFSSLKTGWSTTDSALVKTDNYGADWDTLFITSDIIRKFSFIDNSEAWAVSFSNVYYTNDGWESYVIKTSVITKIDDSYTEPSHFSLHQNYPNPFNSSTTIEFKLEIGAKVELIVLDITGKKITDLLKEYRSPGKYSVHFNANNMASGVYFYRLKAGPYRKIRKMLLIK